MRSLTMKLWLSCIVLGACLFGGSESAEGAKRCFVRIIADTNDVRIGNDVSVDVGNVSSLFRDNVAEAQLDLKTVTGNAVTSNGVLSAIRAVQLRPEDTLVVYFAGHGGFERGGRGQFISPSRQRLYRSDIRREMLARKARLCILLTDTCSNYVKTKGGMVHKGVDESLVQDLPTTSPAFVSLCWKPKGLVDISGSKPSEVAMGNSIDGGYFTSVLCDYLRAQQDNASLSWPTVVRSTRTKLERKFREEHPNGLLPPAVPRAQFTQTVDDEIDFGNRPPVGRGVVVTRVFPNTASGQLQMGEQAVRLEVNDIVVSVNGRPTNTPQDFGKAIDRIGQGGAITLQVLDSRTGRVTSVSGRLDRGGGYRFGATVDDR